MVRLPSSILALESAAYDVRRDMEKLIAELNEGDFQRKFQKCKECLALLYYDQSYASRSNHVNKVLNDPEVQEWIRECQR